MLPVMPAFRRGAALAAVLCPFLGASLNTVSASGRGAVPPLAAADAAFRRFEVNEGQFARDVRFVARSRRDALLLMRDGAIVRGRAGSVGMRWGGGRAGITPLDPLPGVTNYLRGSDPSRWRRNVRSYGRVRYSGVAPGIDLEFYGTRTGFEYDVRVAPGADLGAFAVRFDGAPPRVDAAGDLLVPAGEGTLRQHQPIAYQTIDGRRVPVDVRYDVRGRTVRLRAAIYDRGRELVIDPALEFATYLGGSSYDGAKATAVDGTGNIYVAGDTFSTDFPTNGPPKVNPLNDDVFVAKLSPDGSTLIYCTFIGGSGGDDVTGLAVSSTGSVYIGGSTDSTNFPLVSPVQPSVNGFWLSGFVSRLDSDGSTLLFSTYLGGSHIDGVDGIAVDAAGNAYVAGLTRSTDFPLLNAFQTSIGSSFVAKFTASGALAYSTYFGGPAVAVFPEHQVAVRAIAADAGGSAYLAGEAVGAAIPISPGAFQPTPGAGRCPLPSSPYPCSDAFVAKLSPIGQFAYGTYLRETTADGRNDGATGIAVDASGAAYVTGYTQSASFPTTSGAYREACLTRVCGNVPDAASLFNTHTGELFVTKVNGAGTGLVYSTLLGGLQGESPDGIAVDKAGYATVTGWTYTSDFPLVSAHQPLMGSGPLLRTSDAGATWTSLNGPPGRKVGEVAVAVDGTVFASGDVPRFTPSSGLFKSVDAGITWTQILGNADSTTLSLDPNNASTLYARGLKSVDAGATWTAIAALPDGTAPDPLVTPGDSNTLFASSGGSPTTLYKSANGGASWMPIGSGLPFTKLTFAIAPSVGHVMYAWSGSTLHTSVDGGASWVPRTVPSASLSNVVIDPFSAATLYASFFGGVARSLDGGFTWQKTLTGEGVLVEGVARTSPTTVIASDRTFLDEPSELGTLYRSTDGGQTWAAVRGARLGRGFAANPAAPTQGFEINGSYIDGFVTTIANDGGSLVYSSFIGGSADDIPQGVAVAADGRIVVAGATVSLDLPTRAALQPASAGQGDGFVLALRPPVPVMSIDAPGNATTQTKPFSISGWALDRGATADCGIDGLHVWAFPPGGAPMFITAAIPSGSRPDVAALYGPQFAGCGFDVPVGGLPSGAYQFALFPHSSVTNAFAAPRILSVTIDRRSLIAIDAPVGGTTTYRGARLSGWTLNRFATSGTGIDAVHVWAFPASGQAPVFAGVGTLGIPRLDVGALYGSQFNNAGYEVVLPPLTPGDYLFAAWPLNSFTGTFDPPATVRATVGAPVRMSIDTPANGATIPAGTSLGGWALDLASSSGPGIDTLHVWAFPNPGSGQPPIFAGVANYGVARPDIGAIFGSRFTNSGFNLNLSLAPGTYTLAVVPHSAVTGAFEAFGTLLVTIR
jgi:photosystem II stability/assembly factor-like uncharacterized protein